MKLDVAETRHDTKYHTIHIIGDRSPTLKQVYKGQNRALAAPKKRKRPISYLAHFLKQPYLFTWGSRTYTVYTRLNWHIHRPSTVPRTTAAAVRAAETAAANSGRSEKPTPWYKLYDRRGSSPEMRYGAVSMRSYAVSPFQNNECNAHLG